MSNWETWVSLADAVLNLITIGLTAAGIIRKRIHPGQ